MCCYPTPRDTTNPRIPHHRFRSGHIHATAAIVTTKPLTVRTTGTSMSQMWEDRSHSKAYRLSSQNQLTLALVIASLVLVTAPAITLVTIIKKDYNRMKEKGNTLLKETV